MMHARSQSKEEECLMMLLQMINRVEGSKTLEPRPPEFG